MSKPSSNESLAYDDVGEGAPLLLLHAGIANRTMWDAQVRALSPSHRVIRCDLRGFGESHAATELFAHHDDIATLLDNLGVESVTVVGNSFGGNVALDFAVAYPERVNGLMLVSTLAGMDEPSAELQQVWRTSETAFENGDIDLATAIEVAAWIDGGRQLEEIDPGFRAKAESMIRQIWERANADGEPAEELDFDPPAAQRLDDVKVAVQLVMGDHEVPDVSASHQRLAAGIPHATSVVIANCSHLAPLERPDEFNRFLSDFLASR